MKLNDKTVLVTGAGQGIGEGIALELARQGADIALNVLDDNDQARRVRDAIIGLGRRCEIVQADVSSVAAVRGMLARALGRFGHLEILVNNAGIQRRAPFVEVHEDDYDRILGVNLKGPFFLTQAFVQALAASGRPGKVINISSVHESLPSPQNVAYTASKGGLQMMMRTLAIELAPLGITVNNVAPGAIRTPMNDDLLGDEPKLRRLEARIPLRRMGTTADVAGVVAFLASADADYITGTTTVVDGGLLWSYEAQ